MKFRCQIVVISVGLFLSACSLGKEPPKRVAAIAGKDCIRDFLATDSTWHVQSYDADGKHRDVNVQGDHDSFTPIQTLWVRDGLFYVQTWGSEGLPAEIDVDSGELTLRPKYLAWLGGDDEIGVAAKRVAPYADMSAIHHLDIVGSCKTPDSLQIRIGIQGKSDNELGVIDMVSGTINPRP